MSHAAATLPEERKGELRLAIERCRSALLFVALFTGLVNVLALTSSLFMLTVYDYAIPSQSIPTLVGLGIFCAVMFVFSGVLEAVRGRVLARIGATLVEDLGPRIFGVIVTMPLRGARGDGLAPLRDLDTIRGWLSGVGPTALFDLPWIPFYLLICFAFHPLIGVAALVGALLLIAVTWWTEIATAIPGKAQTTVGLSRYALTETARRNAEALASMGMTGSLLGLWRRSNGDYIRRSLAVSDLTGVLSTTARMTRLGIQSFVLGVGAFLVIKQEASGGVMIAASVLSARALAPVDLAVANWRQFGAARESWKRLSTLLREMPDHAGGLDLPAPTRSLMVENLTIAPPGVQRVVVQGVSFGLAAGTGLGVIGPSASGKSSLSRALVGVWSPLRGSVRLDGAPLEQWPPDRLGRHIGYLPQGVELLDGTVAENIARFDPQATAEKIVDCAVKAGVHRLILDLPAGYQTVIGEGGVGLSAGQRQRVALARALYGDPFLVVLDEPNSNLDGAGDDALTGAILGVRERGGVVIVVAHRPSALAGVNKVLMMRDGLMQLFGDKDEVLQQVMGRPAAEPVPAPATAEHSLAAGGGARA